MTKRRAILAAADDGGAGRRVFIATPTAVGFQTNAALPAGLELRGVGETGTILGEAIVRDGATVAASDSVRDSARYLESEHVLVVVHRTEDIAKNLGGDTRKALRHVLGALEEDPAQLDNLLKLTEKVIFDSDDVVRSGPLHPVRATEERAAPTAGPRSLAVDAAGRKAARRKRSLASGDIVVLLDALMRRLGEGLATGAAPRRPNDHGQIGSDDEDGGEPPDPVDFEALARACRGKVRRLINRMEKRLEAGTDDDHAGRSIVQLAAVLGVVRTLRLIERRPEWRRAQLELVNREDEWRLLEIGVLAVAWGEGGIAQRAIVEAGGEGFDELSMCLGLMGWLAWDSEVDVTEAAERGGLQGVEDETWYWVQLLAALGPWLVTDDLAWSIVEESVPRTPRLEIDGDRWLRVHRGLLEAFAVMSIEPEKAGHVGRRPRPGDLVVLKSSESPRVRVILDVQPARDGDKVVFFDPNGTDGERVFLSSRVATMPWVAKLSAAASA